MHTVRIRPSLGIRPSLKSVRRFSALALALLAAPALTAPLSAQSVSGRLLDSETRLPVSNGTVSLLDTLGIAVARVLTDPEGHFTLRAPGPGRYRLRGSGFGYRGGLEPRFDLVRGQDVTTDLFLVPDPLQLDPIEVSAERIRSELERQGFFKRREQGRGFFLTPAQLKARPPITEAELVSRAPFVEIERGWTGSRIWMRRAGSPCEPQIYVDDLIVRPTAGETHVVLENHVNFADIVALEVYRGYSEIPQELAVGFENTCGVIMIWTVWSQMRSGKAGGGGDRVPAGVLLIRSRREPVRYTACSELPCDPGPNGGH